MRSPSAPTFEQDIAMRAARQDALKQASKKGVKVNALRQQVAAEMSKPETYTDKHGTRQRMSTPDPDAVERETLRRAEEQVPEIARQKRVSEMGWGEYLAQVPKSPILGATSAAGTGLKGLATISRKIVDQVADTRGFDTRDAYVYQLGELIESKSKEILRSNPDLEKEFFIGKAPSTLGQVGVFVLGGWATQSPKLAVSVLGGTMTAGDAYDEVRAMGGTDEEAVNAGLIAGAVLGPTEMLGMRGAMKALAGTPAEATLKAALRTALREGRKDVIENALQELGQEYLQGKITGRDRSFDELLEAAILGGIGGTATVPISLTSQAVQARRTKAKPADVPGTSTIETQPAAPTQPPAPSPAVDAGPIATPRATPTATATTQRPATGETPAAPQQATRPRYIHPEYGEVEILSTQVGANKSRYRVAEVADPEIQHYVKKSDLKPITTTSASPAPLPAEIEVAPPSTDPTAESLPEQGPRNMGQRIENAEERFISSAMQSARITRQQAVTALAKMKEAKAITIDPVGGQFTYTHGAFADPDVIRKAAGLKPLATPTTTSPRPRSSKPSAPTTPRSQPGREFLPTGERADISLAQFVRKRGGIAPSDMYRGELDRLRGRQTKTTGLINQHARQGNVSQTADIMMQAANDAGFRDPATGQPFENPGDFLYAVERDVAGDRLYSSHRDTSTTEAEFAAQEAAYYAEQEARTRAENARIDLLESGRGAELYDRIREGSASNAEREEFSTIARGLGLDRTEIADLIEGDPGEADGLEATSFAGSSEAAPARAAAEQPGPEARRTGEPQQRVAGDSDASIRIVNRARADFAAEEGGGTLGAVYHVADAYDRAGKLESHIVSGYDRGGHPVVAIVAPESGARTLETEFAEGTAEWYLNELRQRNYDVRPVSESALSSATGPTQQLGLVEEGLTQQVAPGPRQPDQRERLIREERERQDAAHPERAAAMRTLEEIRRRGMTVDEYARQGDLFGNVPSAEEVRLLRDLEARQPAPPVAKDASFNFGPGTMRAGEPIPEVKERKFGKRFTEDERIAQEIRDSIGTAKYYEPISEDVTANDAKRIVDERGIGESIRIIRDEHNGVSFNVRNVMGQIVIQKINQTYRNLKDSDPAAAEIVLEQGNEMAEFLMEFGTRLGQGVQSFAQWARQTPEGILLTFTKAARKAGERQKQLLSADVKEILRTVNANTSDAERVAALQELFKTNKTARKIKADIDKILKAAQTGKLTDSLFYEIVGDKLGLPGYNRDLAHRITDLAHQIEAAPEGLPRNKLVLELQRLLAEQKGFDVVDLPLGIFYGNILSGYNTHAVNFADTALNVVSEVNVLALNEPRAAAKIYAGLLRGFGEGKYDALLELTQGRMVTDGKWLEVPRLMEVAKFGKPGGVPIKVRGPISKATKQLAESKFAVPLNAYKYVTRAMAASDALMFRAAKEARATVLAYRMAKAEGLTGTELEARVREILALDREADFMAQAKREGFTGNEAQFRAKELREMVRDKDLSADAAEFAGEATYNHKPHGTLGLIAERIGKLSEDVKPLKLFVPFTRIVANVTNRGLNYTPYGYKRALAGWGFGENTETLTAEGRRQMLTRATLGTAGMALLGVMQQAGLLAIHGNGPNDREKRRQLMNAGWRPHSLQIGKVYVSYLYSPVGLGLSILGNWSDSERYHELEQKDAATRAAYATVRIGSTIFSQSFLSGLTRLFDALSDDSYKSVAGIKRSLSGTVSGLTTPNLVRDLYRLFDNKAYQSNTLMEDLIRNTPFAVFRLKPALNAFGEPVTVQRQRFFDIQTSDPAWRFVIEKGLRVSVPGRTIEMEKGRRITPEEYYDLLKTTGPKVKDWILKNQKRLSKMREQDAQDALSEAAARIRKFELVKMKMKARSQKRAA